MLTQPIESIWVTGCAQNQSVPDAPAKAIERQLEARISKNNETFAGTFCSDFEFDAPTKFDSFGAVKATIEEMACTVVSISDQEANVTCTGSVDVVYDVRTITHLIWTIPVYSCTRGWGVEDVWIW